MELKPGINNMEQAAAFLGYPPVAPLAADNACRFYFEQGYKAAELVNKQGLQAQLVATLIQARVALKQSTPKAGQHVEPMNRHIDALVAIDTALEAVGLKRYNIFDPDSQQDIGCGFYYGATPSEALNMALTTVGRKTAVEIKAFLDAHPNLQITEVK